MAKTRLNDSIRRDILDSVIAALPDTSTMQDALGKRIQYIIASTLPKEAKALWDNPSTRWHIATTTFYTLNEPGVRRISVTVPDYDISLMRSRYSMGSALSDSQVALTFLQRDPLYVALVKKYQDQCKANDAARQELKTALWYRLTTVEGFIEAFPELASHAPGKNQVPVANLPSTTAVMDSLKAAGYVVPATNPA